RITVSKEAIKKFKDRIREITKGIRRVSFMRLMSELKTYMTGWKSYFRIAGFKGIFKYLDGWVRRRIRCYIWQQWTGFKARRDKLVKFGIPIELAAKAASSRLGAWRLSTSQVMGRAFPNKYFDQFQLPRLYDELKPR
ncbi:MAG: transposase, partial [Oligoflexia bacterium]|nr:transposase [Oligoflexia bacterium]